MGNYKYNNSDIAWIGAYPLHWKIDRIKDKTTAVVGGDWGNDPDSDAEGENVVVLRVADLNDIHFKYEDLTIRKIKDGSFKTRKIDEKCLIIEKSGGGEKQLVGRVGYPKNIDFDAISSNFMAKIEFDSTVDIEFMNFVFYNLYKRNLNYPYVQQTTGIQNLNVGYYLATKIAFPPRDEQKLISDYLLKIWNQIEKIKLLKFGTTKLSYDDNTENQIKTLLKYRDSIIHECVTGKKQVADVTTNKIQEINA
jgi:type I restriction enzyme, S subunit